MGRTMPVAPFDAQQLLVDEIRKCEYHGQFLQKLATKQALDDTELAFHLAIEKLKDACRTHTEKIASLEAKLEEQTARLSEQTTINNDQANIINTLTTRMDDLELMVKSLQEQNNQGPQ